jgi:murein L,D-transpeptidase YcbB/YkuD
LRSFSLRGGTDRLRRLGIAGGVLGLALLPPVAWAQPAGDPAASPAGLAAAPVISPDAGGAPGPGIPADVTVVPVPDPAVMGTPGGEGIAPAVVPPAPTLQPLGPLPPGANPRIAEAIGSRFDGTEASVIVGGRAYPAEGLRTFYRSRGHAALWVDGHGLTPGGVALAERLDRAREDGLDASLYRIDTAPAAGQSMEALAAADIALSMALVRYATDLSIGRGAASRGDPNMRATAKSIDPTALLLGAAVAPDTGAYLAGLGPQGPLYQGLRAALARYRAVEQDGHWAALPAGAALQPGSTGPDVTMVRRVLIRTGDLAGAAGDQPLYDEALTEAVKAFQRRHRLAVTGSINAETRQAFNVPPATRVRQILVNMERRRWMPDDLGNPHIFVNLPDYVLNVMQDNASIMKMNVVIGKPTWPTPIFSDLIEYLEVNPHWHVPPTILKKEVLPKMRANPGYAAASGLRVFHNGRPIDPYSVNWAATSGAGYSFRQDPGERNALGRVKFMLPNEFAVYLHDTPSKALFGRSQRAFSHGCVRVQRPLDLAEYLLKDEGWTRTRIESAIKGGKNRAISLSSPMPVHLTYFTALPDSDGIVQFSNDVYGRDATLGRTLFASVDHK